MRNAEVVVLRLLCPVHSRMSADRTLTLTLILGVSKPMLTSPGIRRREQHSSCPHLVSPGIGVWAKVWLRGLVHSQNLSPSTLLT